jgi:hypothetical protein
MPAVEAMLSLALALKFAARPSLAVLISLYRTASLNDLTDGGRDRSVETVVSVYAVIRFAGAR